MKNHKRIAVIIGDIYHEYQQRLMNGIIRQARALRYDIAVFTMFMNFDEETNYQFGENHIFSLINYNMFDAVIYVPCSIRKRALRDYFAETLAEKCHVPVVVLEFEHPDYHTVMIDDTAAYERVVSHLIECHGAKDILCLTGFQGNLQAESRLQGYRNAMAKHGLPVREDRVIYGDFWQAAAYELAEKLATGMIPMPDAVACVSDFVALNLCNRLIEFDIRVPEDIIIVGFDATQEAKDNVPSITTYVRPLVGLGMQAVIDLHKLLTGEDTTPVEEDLGHLVAADSCGCIEDPAQKLLKHHLENRQNINYQTLFQSCHMAESLNSAPTLNHCLGKIINHLYLIQQIRDFYLCLCENWDDFERNELNGDAYKLYTNTMRLRIKHTNGHSDIIDQPFERSLLLPAFWEEHDEPLILYFTPLHFNERCFGYCAMGYGDQPKAFDDIYHSWMRNIHNALEFVRVRNIFNIMNQRLYLSSIRDALTGVFNRKGFDRFSAEIFQRAVTSGKKLLIIAADLDCLKPINDNFGHLEGDNAISVVANALNTCFENDEICARVGGDEFFIIGCSDYTDEKVQQYLDYIQQFLKRYNDSSDRGYLVETSVGYICRTVTAKDDLQALLDEADINMYSHKMKRKKNRV